MRISHRCREYDEYHERKEDLRRNVPIGWDVCRECGAEFKIDDCDGLCPECYPMEAKEVVDA